MSDKKQSSNPAEAAPVSNRRRGTGSAEAIPGIASGMPSEQTPVRRRLGVVVEPKENRLESLFVYELKADGRRVDPSGGTFIAFDTNNTGKFDATVGRHYDFDWYLVGADGKAVTITFLYPDASVAALVPESQTRIRDGRQRSFGVMDLPQQGAIR